MGGRGGRGRDKEIRGRVCGCDWGGEGGRGGVRGWG